MAKKKPLRQNTVCLNRRARHDYHIEESLEAGLVLFGSEVKSLRSGRASIIESYATEQEGEIFVLNANIPAYGYSHIRNHEPTRPRKLLLKKREVQRLIGAITRKGMTLVPLAIYFNDRGKAKLELGIAKGKRKYEKRETEKARDGRGKKQG